MTLQDTAAALKVVHEAIGAWCTDVAPPAWQMREPLCMVVEDTPLWLEFDAEETPPVLRVLAGLGEFDHLAPRDLLQLNYPDDPQIPGCFGREPQSGCVVLRMAIHLEGGVSGADIPSEVDAAVKAARAKLFSISTNSNQEQL